MIVQHAAQPVTQAIAKIIVGKTVVSVLLPERDETFRRVVRSLGYRWSGSDWRRAVGEMTGGPQDRAAELCAALLASGFVVDAPEDTVRQAAAGDWQPEHKRWVLDQGGKFALFWRGQDEKENLYARARMLPSSEYDPISKSVIVDPLYFGEVIGFAEVHNFHLTQAAQDLVTRARRAYERTLIPDLPAPARPATPKKERARRCNPAAFADLPERSLQTLTQLYPHQTAAVDKLLGLRIGGLFMDMGTGKTRAAIEMAVRRQQRASRVVWFCPVSLKLTIAAEIAKHSSGGAVYVFDDETAESRLPEAFWYVVGIESMSSSDRIVLAVNRLVDQDAFVIVDESSYIKGASSKRTLRITEIARRARYRLLLTGTPITQGVEDLYAQMRFLSPDILGYNSFYSFANNHLEYSDKYPGLVVNSLNMDVLADKAAPFVYQVTKAECLDLPEKLFDSHYFYMTDEQKDAYWQAKEEIILSLDDDEITSYTIFKLFTALQEIVCGFWNRNGETRRFHHHRTEQMNEIIDHIPNNDKVIIWSKFRINIDDIVTSLEQKFGPGCVAQLHGGIPEKQRQAEIERFRHSARFLVSSQSTGGHGLTLTEAHYVIFYSNEFKYASRIQAEDRCHRIGQDQPVTYFDLVCQPGIDNKITSALSRKQDAVRAFKKQIDKIKDDRTGIARMIGDL